MTGQDRLAVVTASASGIGLVTAKTLTRDGWRLVLSDADEDMGRHEARQLNAEFRPCDVRDADQIAALFDGLSPHVLVNNAGIAGPDAVTWEYPIADWHRVLDIDLNGVFYCCRAVLPGMIARNYGRVVNVASIAGKEGNPRAPAYSAAKAGVIALTKSLGKELAGYDISVNCVTPAAARTRIFDQVSERFTEYMLSKIPRGRFVTVEEIAALIAWLCTRECSFSTGAVFDISGGRATY